MSLKELTRRAFLHGAAKTAAGAVAAPYVITSSALGNAHALPASERITLGHIGVGGRGSDLLNGFLHLRDAQCIAVCDPFQSRREGQAKRIDTAYAEQKNMASYKACAPYRDFRELLARDDLDAVVIATPDHWHVLTALAAARAGKDLYVEKPLGLTHAQRQVLRQTVNRYGVIFQYGTQQRCGRNFRHTCELVRNGYIGDLQTIYVWCAGGSRGGSTQPASPPADLDYDLWLGPAPLAPYTPDRCTNLGAYFVSDYALGYIAGWGAHPLDIAQWGNHTDHTGPIEYEGTGTFPTEGLYNTATDWDVQCVYAKCVKLRFMSWSVAAPLVAPYGPFTEHGTMFFGTKGWVNVDRVGMYASDPALVKAVLRPDEVHLYESERPDQNFLDCIRTRATPINTIEAAVRSDTISHLSDIAIRTGRRLVWDPQKEVLVGDEAAARLLERPLRSPWRL